MVEAIATNHGVPDGSCVCTVTLPRKRNLEKPLRIRAFTVARLARIAGAIAGRPTPFRNRKPTIRVRFWVGIGFWLNSLTQSTVP